MSTPIDQPTGQSTDNHNMLIGYALWILGFLGAHRFFYGKPKTATLYFFTLGLLGIGWLIDLFLIPSMDRAAERRFASGAISYNIAWLLLTFLGFFGVHRFYQRKYISGIIYLCTGGLFLVGYLYDYWTLNKQLSELNSEHRLPLI